MGEIFGAGAVPVGGGENRSTHEIHAPDTRTRLVDDRTGGVEVVAPQGHHHRTDGSGRRRHRGEIDHTTSPNRSTNSAATCCAKTGRCPDPTGARHA